MDGPNVNLSFHKKIEKHLLDNHNKKIINIGTCSLHKMHTAFMKGLEKVDFNYDEFAQDCHFFFKYSAARTADYNLTSMFTGLQVENML
jgi:hypothetical protein